MKKLADEAGFLPGYVSLVESGKKNPRIGNALRLARALGLDVGELIQVREGFKLHGAARGKKKSKQRR